MTTTHMLLDLSLFIGLYPKTLSVLKANCRLILVILLNEGMLIVSMLHSYRQAKGDIKGTGGNAGVKYVCLKVKRT